MYRYSIATQRIYDTQGNVVESNDLDLLAWLENNVLEEHQFFAFEEELIARRYPTIARSVLLENGINFLGRDVDILLDTYEFFKAKEKQYSLKGDPLYKDYVYVKNGVEVLVCRISYHKVYEDKTLMGITKNEFIGTYSRFTFYREGNNYTDDKIIDTLNFELAPTVIWVKDAQGNNTEQVLDVLWANSKRNEVLYDARHKADQKMAVFNPALYYLLTRLITEPYTRYKETGDKSDLVFALENSNIPQLQGEVSDDDKEALGIPLNYSLTVLQLILNALQ